MPLRKHRLLIVIAFMGIFTAKMVISGAPVFFSHLDRGLLNAVIMQLEVENQSDDAGKSKVKFADQKYTFLRYDLAYIPLPANKNANNNILDRFRRYLDPFYPSVPTPPPNFS